MYHTFETRKRQSSWIIRNSNKQRTMSSASSRRPSEAIAASPFYENEFQYEICDCANCCLCLNAFWCPGVVWAQIMTRLKFNSLGFPDARGYKHTFGIFVGLWVVYLISYSLFILKESCVNAQEAARQQSYGEHTSTVTAPQHCYTNLGDIARIVSLICLVFMFLVKVMARNSFRRRARIQGVFCCCNAGKLRTATAHVIETLFSQSFNCFLYIEQEYVTTVFVSIAVAFAQPFN